MRILGLSTLTPCLLSNGLVVNHKDTFVMPCRVARTFMHKVFVTARGPVQAFLKQPSQRMTDWPVSLPAPRHRADFDGDQINGVLYGQAGLLIGPLAEDRRQSFQANAGAAGTGQGLKGRVRQAGECAKRTESLREPGTPNPQREAAPAARAVPFLQPGADGRDVGEVKLALQIIRGQ